MRNIILVICGFLIWMFFLFLCGVWALIQIAIYPIVMGVDWLENKFPRNRKNSDQNCGDRGINNG